MSRKYWTIGDIQSECKGHWFDKGTMRFFRSIVDHNVYEGLGGVFFVSSEKYVPSRGESGPRLYSVRKYNPQSRSISTVGAGFQGYKTKLRAVQAAKRLSEGKDV